jgi:predicted HicB family RNase H-like nuclease
MPEEKKFTLRIPDNLHERVKILSEKENRSLNKEILELIKRGIESEATKQLRFFE